MTYHYTHTKISIVGGTLFSALANLEAKDFFTTTIMAFFGACISYIASLLIKYVHRVVRSLWKQYRK